MRRGKPLQAKRWGIVIDLEKRRAKRARSGREDLEYLAAVRTLPCCVCGQPAEPHHAGRRPGEGLKCHDRETIPMCRLHHQAIERDQWPFKGWIKQQRFAWVDLRIAETQARCAAILGRPCQVPKTTTPFRSG